jgi:signal transduction histidine kinase
MVRLDRSAAVTGALALAVIAIAALAIFATPASEAPVTYRATSPVARVVGLGAGAAVVAAALLRTRGPVALLLLALAALWFGQDLAALGDSAALIRSIAVGAAPLAAAVALHLALALKEGRLSRSGRAAAATAYVAAATVAVGTLTLRDPFLDVYCWRACGGNPLLVHAVPRAAHAFVVAGCALSVAAGAVAVGVAVARLRAASRVGRALVAPALVPAALVAGSEAARGAVLLRSPLEDPGRAGFMAVYLLRAAALAALAAGVTWLVLRTHRTRARMARLAAELGAAPPPGTLRDALRAALADPTVDVLYWVPAIDAFVDVGGALRPAPQSTATQIARGGRLLAVVVHDASALPGGELQSLLGPAARLAIENEALRAEVMSQLRQLRDSRARIVATADESRRRLERDLHDGAQQRLLAVVLDLRLARTGANGEIAERLQHISDEVDRAFGELRELAHGIYPAVLTESGLGAALPTLADVAPITVQLQVTDQRLPPAVEAGAYVTVEEAIRDAAVRRATGIDITAGVHDGLLLIAAHDDGEPRAASLVHLADRVGALGGELDVAPTILRAQIPCA